MRHLHIAFALLIATLVQPGMAVAERPHTNEPSLSVTANAARTSVFVSHTGTDAAGAAFVAGLRGGIRASPQFRLTLSETDANLVLVVVSVSPASTGTVASAVSLAYVANNEWRSLLGSAARFVGRDRAESMGRATVAELLAVLAAYDPTVDAPAHN